MINQSEIRRYSHVSFTDQSRHVVNEAVARGEKTAFLSHSHKDAELASGLQGFLNANGWKVYIDWQDTSMPDSPNRETAQKIKDRIIELDWFIFLATQNSMSSRWCPWEIGYADGKKHIDKIVIAPTKDGYGSNYGNEYLNLYRQIGLAQSGRGWGLFNPTTKEGSLLKEIVG